MGVLREHGVPSGKGSGSLRRTGQFGAASVQRLGVESATPGDPTHNRDPAHRRDAAGTHRGAPPREPNRAGCRTESEDVAVPDPACEPGMAQHFLAGRSLVKRFGERKALAHVDFGVRSGEVVAIVGPSGSGKTTLLQVVAGVLCPDEGAVVLDGHRVDRLGAARRRELRRSEFGFVFPGGSLFSELTTAENAALPLMLRAAGREQALASAREWLRRLRLDGWERRRPGELSRGQVARVAIARALIHRPKAVFADEPAGGLDERTGSDVWDALLRSAAGAKAAVVMATQDRDLAARADRVVEIRGGRLVGGAMTG